MAVPKITTSGQRKTRIQAQKCGLTNDSTSMAGHSLSSRTIPKLSLFCTRYFLKFEKFVPNKNSWLVDTALRGSDGPVEGAANSSFIIGVPHNLHAR
jgi:hypothetical protein